MELSCIVTSSILGAIADNELSVQPPINRTLSLFNFSQGLENVWAAGAFNTIKITCGSEGRARPRNLSSTEEDAVLFSIF